MPESSLPTIEEIYANHEEIVKRYDIDYPGTGAFFPDDKLSRVIERAAEYDDVHTQSATFLKQIPRVHVFEDGNKRTAWLTVLELLDRNGLEPVPKREEAETVLKRRQRFNVEELAHWLRTGEIDRNRLA